MAMQFNDGESEDDIVAEINITPLTDIFLVLLIIFMISSSAMLEGGLNVKLPSAKAGQLASDPNQKPIFVTVSRDGAISVNDKKASQAFLETALREAIAETAGSTVIIRGDEKIQLGIAVQIMDAARSAGAEKIALATKPNQ